MIHNWLPGSFLVLDLADRSEPVCCNTCMPLDNTDCRGVSEVWALDEGFKNLGTGCTSSLSVAICCTQGSLLVCRAHVLWQVLRIHILEDNHIFRPHELDTLHFATAEGGILEG